VASEKELIAQFGVSKATVREALRVLEAMGLVEIRKGIQGGVFIAEVDMKTTIHSIMNFLHFKAISIHDITMLRFMLEPSVAYIAAERLTPEDIRRLEQMIELGGDRQAEISKDIGFHRYLARLSDNPILILIMDFIDNLLRDVKSQIELSPGFYNRIKACHRRILDCLASGDAMGARREIARDILIVGEYMADATGAVRFDPAELGFDPQGALTSASDWWADGPVGPELSSGMPDPSLPAQGMLFRKVGSGDLYLLVPPQPKRGQLDREDSGLGEQPAGPEVPAE
jgi:GntR family transcriptional repressor for pyruvate dehydrogenase complex